MWQVEKVAIDLPTLAGWTTLFFVDSTCRPWQVDGHVLNLPTLAGWWPVFSHSEPFVLNLPTLAGSWPLFSHWPNPWWEGCPQPADLGRLMASFQPCNLNLPTLAGWRPVFSPHGPRALNLPTLAGSWPLFSPYLKWPWTCRPWQVDGHFPQPADLGRFMATFQPLLKVTINLPTSAGSWPLFRTTK